MSTEHTDVAAYALDLLDPPDRQKFETHLAGCESCAAELAEFASMARLFDGVDPIEADDPAPDESAVVDLVSRQAAIRRRTGRRRGWLAAAACAVLLAGGGAAGALLAPGSTVPAATVQLTGELHRATNPAQGGITGVVGLVSHPWGTQVVLKLSRVRGPLQCQLIAVSKTGERRVMMGWLVPAAGYGVRGHPADLLIEGGTSISSGDLKAIQIQVVGGPTLLTIPI